MDKIKGLKEYVLTKRFREGMAIPDQAEVHYEMLAQGEYNVNYLFTHPISKKQLVLRVNIGSQMHLADQIGYEYQALKLLLPSGRTPKPLYADGSREYLDYGVLVMEYLPGRTLNYNTDLKAAAQCLADIHSVKTDGAGCLIPSQNPLAEILRECRQMIQVYFDSPLGDPGKKRQIERMLQKGENMEASSESYRGYRCCINTELNSTNFLINGPGKTDYLIDWEKPLLGDPAQDLGHFLAPTTTFWKSDVILSSGQIDDFMAHYQISAGDRFALSDLRDRVNRYIPITCLRGLTWCAMAWIEYQDPKRLIQNESTRRKLDAYLEQEFLDRIEQEYLNH